MEEMEKETCRAMPEKMAMVVKVVETLVVVISLVVVVVRFQMVLEPTVKKAVLDFRLAVRLEWQLPVRLA